MEDGMTEDAWDKLFDSMVDKGLKPNEISYNVLIDGYCKNRNLGEMQLYKKMKRNGLKPTTTTAAAPVLVIAEMRNHWTAYSDTYTDHNKWFLPEKLHSCKIIVFLY
ncbi:hypothetical protein C5167_035444 [Papaver somniferum]|uniref:Pentacotripeptide-repeat region of PRORP domain-containing protein n=1 Tax=Papaver somniferum TaxID=3469 RepID=A0A4Y7KJC0_PAPSO|nr:hypothetical protein C5167_035444 [Papaver somniferum]